MGQSEKKSRMLTGVVSVYKNKRSGAIVIQPMIQHPTIGAPTEYGPSLTVPSLGSESRIVQYVAKGFDVFHQRFDEAKKLCKSPLKHREFDKQHNLVRITRYNNDSVGILPFHYEKGMNTAQCSDEVILARADVQKCLMSALKEAFRGFEDASD